MGIYITDNGSQEYYLPEDVLMSNQDAYQEEDYSPVGILVQVDY